MSTIYELTYNALSGLGYPLAPTVWVPSSGDERPDLYLIYFVVTASPVQHADNSEKHRSYLVQVNIFSRDGLNDLPDVRGAMLAAGFTAGPLRDLPFSTETEHYGLSMDFYYLETT